jgi:ribosomal-protein-alanine N-acetyltransferase
MTSSTDTVTIRIAEPRDVPALTELHQRLVGVPYRWANHLGEGGAANSDLALVAEAGGQTVGLLGAGPILPGRMKVTATTVHPPWWKLHALAVDPDYQRRGIASRLLRETVQRLPPRHLGLYGSVSLTGSAAISWYRSRGFYVASPMPLPSTPSFASGAQLVSVPDEVFFRAFTHTITEHLDGKRDGDDEERAARQHFKSWLRQVGRPTRREVGYRTFAARVAANPGPTCVHSKFGPRHYQVFGWDPELRRSCDACITERLNAFVGLDADDFCDGCQRTRPDVAVSRAALYEEMLIVQAGLCGTCRTSKT